MTIFQIFKKLKMKNHPLIVEPQEVAKLIDELSAMCTNRLIGQYKVEYGMFFSKDFMESLILKNYKYLFYYLTKRFLLEKYGEKNGNELYNSFLNSIFKVIGLNMRTMDIEAIKDSFNDEFIKFEEEFRKYEYLPAENDSYVLKGTIYWEFGKKITEIMFGSKIESKFPYVVSSSMHAGACMKNISKLL